MSATLSRGLTSWSSTDDRAAAEPSATAARKLVPASPVGASAGSSAGDSGYTASFVGFAPAEAPRLVISVSIQNPRNGYYGGAVAGPVFRDIMSFSLRSMSVPPTGSASPKLKLRAG